MYYRFGKAFYFFSVFLFIFFLLYFYSALPDSIGYSVDDSGLLQDKMAKSTFFYGMIGIFLLMNAIVLLPPKLLETKNHKGLVRLFKMGDQFRDYYLAWFYSFGGVLNLTLTMMVFYTHRINNQQEIDASEFNFFYYLIPSLFVVWIIGLFAIMVGKFNQVQKNS